MKKSKTQKSLSLTLTQTPLEKRCENDSLGEVIDAALTVINPNRDKYGDSSTAPWLARYAIRAVCEAIVRAGHLPIPIEVEFTRDWMRRRGAQFQHSRS